MRITVRPAVAGCRKEDEAEGTVSVSVDVDTDRRARPRSARRSPCPTVNASTGHGLGKAVCTRSWACPNVRGRDDWSPAGQTYDVGREWRLSDGGDDGCEACELGDEVMLRDSTGEATSNERQGEGVVRARGLRPEAGCRTRATRSCSRRQHRIRRILTS